MVKVQEYDLATGHIETLRSYPDDEYGTATMYAQTITSQQCDNAHVVYVDIEDTEDSCNG